jgi:hypothetical protein
MDDSQCTSGTNGRCTAFVSGFGTNYLCTYDACFVDSDCPGLAVCECGQAMGSGRAANACLSSNCRVDADCGPGGYCSPSYSSCGARGGFTGYYCHTPADDCTNDSDCTQLGYWCGWQPYDAKWTCSIGACGG